MKIYAKKQHTKPKYSNMNLPTKVKQLGDYLTKNLAGASLPNRQYQNGYDIYTTIMYMIKPEVRKAMKQYPAELKGIEDEVYEMTIYLGLATYRQYIRVAVIQLGDNPDDKNNENRNEPTLGFLRLEPDELFDMPYCKDKIVRYVKKVIEKHYENYEVLI